MLLHLGLLPLALGRAALADPRSLVYLPPAWATLDCSACAQCPLLFIVDIVMMWGTAYLSML